MDTGPLQERFAAALERLVAKVKDDRAIVAAVLCGSLSHDTVWARSDIDLVLVTIDDRAVPAADVALDADGINVHTLLIPRAEFRKAVEGSIHNSFVHALLAKGRLLYTHDATLADLFARLRHLGDRDRRVQLLRAATGALAPIDKARKWFVTRGDLEYSALWMLFAATARARIEVIGAGLLADREVLPQAMRLNPAFFKTVYTDLLNEAKTTARVAAALDTIDSYLAARATAMFAPVLEHLREVGEARAASEIESHFTRNFDVAGVTSACEYLAARGLIGRAATPVRLTRRSTVEVEELAFFFVE
jgi:hypothetical protein